MFQARSTYVVDKKSPWEYFTLQVDLTKDNGIYRQDQNFQIRLTVDKMEQGLLELRDWLTSQGVR